MNECLHGERLHQYLSGTMPAEELLQADAHFASCASCRARLPERPHSARAVRALLEKLRWDSRAESNCLDEDQMGAYVEGRLDDSDREVIECHLELCPRCGADVRSLRELRTLMPTSPLPE